MNIYHKKENLEKLYYMINIKIKFDMYIILITSVGGTLAPFLMTKLEMVDLKT